MALTGQQIAEVYRRFGHLVLRRCEIILGEGGLAEDAMHEVFIRVLKYGRGLEQADSKVGWLYRTAERVCFDLWRKNGERVPTPTADRLAVAPDSTNPGASVAARDSLRALLSHFDDRTKQIILMHHVDGWTQDRIAREVGWSRQTVNKRLAIVSRRASALKRSLGWV